MSKIEEYKGVGKPCQSCYKRKASKKVDGRLYCENCLIHIKAYELIKPRRINDYLRHTK